MAKITVTLPLYEYERLKRIEAKEPLINTSVDSAAAYDALLKERTELLAELEGLRGDAQKWRAMPKEAQLPPMNRADAELGALVRKMPETFFVYHGEDGWYLKDGYGRTSGFCETPEQAFERGPTLD
jgi:hypothetical protein